MDAARKGVVDHDSLSVCPASGNLDRLNRLLTLVIRMLLDFRKGLPNRLIRPRRADRVLAALRKRAQPIRLLSVRRRFREGFIPCFIFYLRRSSTAAHHSHARRDITLHLT